MLVHPVAQKVKFWDTQYTLVWVHHFAMCIQAMADFAEVHQVLFLGGAGDENVVIVVVHKREAS